MKIFVIGSGGREHALVWKLSKSHRVKKIYAAPGNAGIRELADCIEIKADDIKSLAEFAEDKKIDLTVVGPEIPLVAGITGEFQRRGLNIFGPSLAASMLEGSKSFAKDFMKKFNIPTAEYEVFEESNKAIDYIKSKKPPYVIKADGLAAGKGVIIAKNFEEATEAIRSIMLDKVFKDAGKKIVIEEYLEGEEATILAFSDGKSIMPMPGSRDHKRIFDNDKGGNTGGMGAYSPAPVITDELNKKILSEILIPTIKGLNSIGRNYKGVLYAGLMITKSGAKVVEFNVRFGDPEAQVVIPKLETDLLDIIEAVILENLDKIEIKWFDTKAVCVVAVSGGYPDKYETGFEIKGLTEINKIDNILVFHAGTTMDINDKIVTSGGRVLGVTGLGSTIKEAITRAYLGVNKIKFEGIHYRKDIGYR